MKKQLLLVLGFVLASAVSLMAQDVLDTDVKKALDALAAGLSRRMNVCIKEVTLDGTKDMTSEVSRIIRNKIVYHASQNPFFNIVVETRGPINQNEPQTGRIFGNYTQDGEMLEVYLTLEIGGTIRRQQRFFVSIAELKRRKISWLPENVKSLEEAKRQEQDLTRLTGTGALDRQTPVPPIIGQEKTGIGIRAWFNDESLTFLHREELEMTIMLDQDGWFKVYTIDTNNNIKMLYPNTVDKNNYLRANSPRDIFENAKYMLYDPGVETIIVVASAKPFKNIEEEYIAPLIPATAEAIRTAIRGDHSGGLEAFSPITFSGESVARFTITILKPHAEYVYLKPTNMSEAVHEMRSDIVRQGGFFEGNELSGCGILNGFRCSYRIPRDAPDTLQFAVYNLDTYIGDPTAPTRTRGAGFEFSFEKPGDMNQALLKARSGIEGKGGVFSGDDQQGSFQAQGVAGNYRVSDVVNVIITEKPAMVPTSIIVRGVKNYFL
jgi:hypothetical protein